MNNFVIKRILGTFGHLAFTVGIDGVAIFKTPSLSMWPIMAINNNLPPDERFKEKNILLLGMWIHESAPPPPSVVSIFVNNFKTLYFQGINF